MGVTRCSSSSSPSGTLDIPWLCVAVDTPDCRELTPMQPPVEGIAVDRLVRHGLRPGQQHTPCGEI